MSDMKRCDRCGKAFDVETKKVDGEWEVPMQVGERFFGSKPKYADWNDLCHGCTKSWEEWFDSGREKAAGIENGDDATGEKS